MKNLLKIAVASTALFALAFAPALAVKPPKCPKCHMALVAKKDKMHTKAVKIKGKTWYCCARCKM